MRAVQAEFQPAKSIEQHRAEVISIKAGITQERKVQLRYDVNIIQIEHETKNTHD